ncbi:MAG TPA: sigma-70 family RNA polymerase sigma factor [Armatimonadota bacterium]|nr:sigma-70 family RNA polymerase sigma factor [Armatimonadota bacterium]
MREPDEIIVDRVRKGDTEAFAGLVSAYRKPIYALVSGMTGENDEAEDVTQTCFVQAYSRLGELRDGHRFGPWLYAIARNRCRDWIRQRSRRPALVDDPSKLRSDSAPGLPTNPEDQALASLRDEAVASAVRSLRAEYRTVVTLRYVGGLSCPEIAEATGVSVSATAMRWHRAKKMLRRQLRHIDDDETGEG